MSRTGKSAPAERRALRVCMVHYSDFRLDSRIQRQARALAERGDEVHLVCLGEREELRVGAGSIRIHPVPMEKARGGASAYITAYGRFLLGALRRVSALELRGRFDVVEAHNMPDILTLAGLLPKLRGAPVILNVHDTFPELFVSKFGRPADHPAVRALVREERLSAALADQVICVTEEARQHLARRGVGLGRSAVVMNSPDERVFGAQRPPSAPPADGPVRVLYHGGLAPRFGVESLIRAVALLDERVSLRVCGSGEDRDRLAALAAELAPERLEVLADPVPFEAIPRELEAAHIGVVPTLRDEFTELLLPVKLLEYVHMGLPAVASQLTGIGRYFGEDSVWPFEPGSPESLAAAIAAVCRQPDEARRRAERAAEHLRSIAWAEQKERYLALVDRLVAGRRGQAPAPARRPVSSAGTP